MKPETLEIRRKTLVQIASLNVHAYTKNGISYFQFGDDRTIATVCTYRKARIFAEGFAAGREHVLHERPRLLPKMPTTVQEEQA